MDTLSLKSLLHVSLLFSSLVFVLAAATTTTAPAPAPAPAPHHHKGGGGHHHHHPKHPPTQPPAHPPTTKPPVHAPIHAPAHAPVKPPVMPVKPPVHSVKPPVQPPTHAPAKPPAHAPTPVPPRKLVAVQGVVYCKPCKYAGVDTLLGATPLLGAVVKLQCNNTKYPLVVQTKTDKNGYFFINAPKTITTYGSHKCRVFVISSPVTACSKRTNLHYGVKGAMLIPSTKPPQSSKTPVAFEVFNVGPFAFEPASNKTCPH